MNQVKAWERLSLLALLALEVWAFSGAFHKFFNLDSLFYIINYPRSWQEFGSLLRRPDASQQYRPLTLGFMGLIVPLFGKDPGPYHWIPLFFHMANTLLFYRLARHLLRGATAIFFAAAFWGLHSVAGWITYDVTCISDFLATFLLLCSILIAINGAARGSVLASSSALIPLGLALLTKESATTFPLALWTSLGLAELRRTEGPATPERIWSAFRKSIPLAAAALAMSAAAAAVFMHWHRAGALYAQGANPAYDINAWSNLAAKFKYLYWALNFPDPGHVGLATRAQMFALGLTGVLSMFWVLDIARRRGRLSPPEWCGLIWFVGLCIPALMLSNRLAKWYLYTPLLGFSLAAGFIVRSVRQWLIPSRDRLAHAAFLLVVLVPVTYSTVVQTRGYSTASDAAYTSDILESFITNFRNNYGTLPRQLTLFMLPALEKNDDDLLRAIARLTSVPPINKGELFELYYPESHVRTLFAHRGDSLPANFKSRSDIWFMQILDGNFYNVSEQHKAGGRMTMFLLPTLEKELPPRLRSEPAGGKQLYQRFVDLQFLDAGAVQAGDLITRRDAWIVSYLQGHFYDVTAYYRSRLQSHASLLIPDLAAVRVVVSRSEFYPDYERFDTPGGGPIFFSTSDHEIFTQIGGSEVHVPAGIIPAGARLRFDISWMFDSGDGAWAELKIRAAGKETSLFREYMKPNPKGKGLRWKEAGLDLQFFARQSAELVLSCYNEPGRSTASDWLNWRGISIEASANQSTNR